MNKSILSMKILLNFCLFVVSSWLLIHVLAVFGFFVGFAYPIWWLIFPNLTICFSCRSKKEGDWCPICKKRVNLGETLTPKSFSSATANGVIVLSLTVISIGLVWTEGKLLQSLGINPPPKTVSFMLPEKSQHPIGEVFKLNIEITGVGQPINAVQADISFDPERLEVVSIGTENSFASIFIQKDIDNKGGLARLVGGLPNPGFDEEKGLFGEVYLKGKSPGIATVEFLPTSKVLANDGRGTNVLKGVEKFSYLILPEYVESENKTPLVLGENSDKTKIELYEENNILGSSNDFRNMVKDTDEDRGDVFLVHLNNLDHWVIEGWKRVLSLPKKLILRIVGT